MKKEAILPILDIDCVFEGFCNKGAIYVSNLSAAKNIPLMQKQNINAVISIAIDGFIHQREQNTKYLYIPAVDHQSYDISQHFDQTYEFLEKHRKQCNVLVHCMAGKSRSATIVAAYLVKKYKYSLENVLSLMKRKRTKINPNQGFIRQLEEYCTKIGVNKCQDNPFKSARVHRCLSFQLKKKDLSIQSPQEIKSHRMRLISQNSTTQSLEKQRQEQEQITTKLQELRSKVIKASRIKNKSKIIAENKIKNLVKNQQGMLQSTVSSTLHNAPKTSIKWKENKSLQFD